LQDSFILKKTNLMKIYFVLFCSILLYSTSNAQSSKAKQNVEVKIVTSSQCEMCKESIEKALAYAKGVKSSNLDIKTKTISVKYNPAKTNPDVIRLEITKIGYDADHLKGDETAYKALPGCCKKP